VLRPANPYYLALEGTKPFSGGIPKIVVFFLAGISLDFMKSIKKKLASWKEGLLAGSKARKDSFKTSSDIPFSELSLPSDEPEKEYLENLGFPGEYPYTRGVHSTMYRGRLWTMRQYAGFGTAGETNKRYKLLLENGTTGLSVAFDLPTQMGRDSDHELAKGEVGRVGVAIDSLNDMETLFEGIPLGNVSTSMTINSTAPILLAMYVAVARKQGVPMDKIRGTTQNDLLKEYIARGTYVYPPAASVKLTADIFEFCKNELPAWNSISISGYHMREAGSTAVQEVAFTLGNGLAYIEAALGRGLKIDDVAPRMAFFFNCHNNFLEEVAKFRAARRLWARIIKERYEPENEKSLMLRFHTQTAGSTLVAQQPLVNIARTTTQALAAVLGGTQSLHTNGYDEALGLPTELAAVTALRTQQYLAYESGVADVVDPLAGSYVIEELTDEIEARAREYIEKVEKKGGMVSAIEEGYPQAEIEEAAFAYQQSLENGENSVVGVNFAKSEDPDQDQFKPAALDPSLEQEQIVNLASFKASRDEKKVSAALESLKQQAENDSNLLPQVLTAVEEGVTVGEISDCFREVYGEYQP